MCRYQNIALITLYHSSTAQRGSSEKYSGCQGALSIHSLTKFLSRIHAIRVVDSSALEFRQDDEVRRNLSATDGAFMTCQKRARCAIMQARKLCCALSLQLPCRRGCIYLPDICQWLISERDLRTSTFCAG